MDIQSLFSLPVGLATYKDLAVEAKTLFENNEGLAVTKYGHRTTLKDYYNGNAVTEEEKHPEIVNKIKDVILKEAKELLKKCGYAVDKYDFFVSNLWLNEMYSGTSSPEHTHYGAVLSGCFYVEMPQNASGINFGGFLSRFDRPVLDIESFTTYNSNYWRLIPEEGTLLMWESYVKHYVEPTEYEGKRRSIAFDVTFGPKKG